MRRTLEALMLFLLAAAACGPGDPATQAPARTPAVRPAAPAPVPPVPVQPTAVAAEREPLVVFLGDSLTAGLGLPADQAYPSLVERRLEELARPVRVLNAGVSGDTTAGGLARLDWLLKQKPDVMVVGLGANDGLRGLELAETERNLREIVRRSQQAGARVLLLGMKIPPNYGPDYAGRFEALYSRIADDMDVPLVPFLLEGVGGVSELNLGDGIHPNARGQERVAENVVPHLSDVLEDLD